jgi:hypothetical protein
MKPRSVTIEAPKKIVPNGTYFCAVVATYPSGAIYVQNTSDYPSPDSAQLAAKGVQAYLQQREDRDEQS